MSIRQPRYKQIYKEVPEMAEMAAIFWSEVINHLEENGLTTKTRLGQADRLCRAKAEYEMLYPSAVKVGPVKLGPNGGNVFNLEWGVLESYMMVVKGE